MASLELIGIHKTFGEVSVLEGVNLAVQDGEFCVFVGPSGCGKSTLLRTIAGLDGGHEGVVRIGGRDVTRATPAERGVAMVFQSYALYPHMTVAANIGFGLKMQGVARPEIEQKVAGAARTLQIEALLDRYPAQLSGGQRQRVAIGRALVREPDIFLFDEPLSNLDAALRVQMRIEISRLHKELGATMIYVTHDQTEAMTMADRIVVLNRGRIEQIGDPLTLYRHPDSKFVAGFMGSPRMNFLPVDAVEATARGPSVLLQGGARIIVPEPSASSAKSVSELGVRAENIVLTGPSDDTLNGTVVLTEQLGSETLVYVDVAGGEPIVVKTDGGATWKTREQVGLGIDPAFCHLFAADGTTIANGTSH